MTTDDPRDLDSRLEDAADPDQAAVERVVSAALEAVPARRRAAGPLAASLALIAIAVTVVVLNRPPKVASPVPIRIRSAGELIVVDYPDGSRAIIGPARTTPGLFDGFNYVILEGERP